MSCYAMLHTQSNRCEHDGVLFLLDYGRTVDKLMIIICVLIYFNLNFLLCEH